MRKVTIILLVVMVLSNCNKKNPEEQVKPDPVNKTKIEDTVKTVQESSLKAISKPDAKNDTIKKIIEKIVENNAENEELSVNQLWDNYRNFREKSKIAFNNAEFQEAITNLKLAAKYATQLNRDDLAAWQYNNIGYYSIQEFKGRTNYDFRLYQIRTIDSKEEKKAYLKETKNIFRKELKILTDAEEFLEKAYKIDEKFNDQNRTDKIYNNLKFIDWVKNFLNN